MKKNPLRQENKTNYLIQETPENREITKSEIKPDSTEERVKKGISTENKATANTDSEDRKKLGSVKLVDNMYEDNTELQNEEMLEAIRNMISESENRIKEGMDSKLESLETETIVIKKDLRNEIKELEKRMERREQEELENVERGDKKRNFMTSGLKIFGNDRNEPCETWILQKLRVTVKVENTWYMKGAIDLKGAELENGKMKKEKVRNTDGMGRSFFNWKTGKETDPRRRATMKNPQILIWNIAGLKNINADTWKYIQEHEIICLEETWHEKKDRSWIKKELSNYRCISSDGDKEHKKGRCSGSMILAYRMKYQTVAKSLRVDQKIWILIGTYVNENKEENLKIWEQLTGEYKKYDILMIGGDMNARTGDKGGGIERKRHARDKITNREGKMLLERIEELGVYIINGKRR
ncbi:hypothetical protein QAD02_013929 [Eretmocerus hayati]|uniref:Uncharacterized protein n=1 Tax=Eretmocerus hayati TaxID=131215 RepID=A0ACC2P427_9HYME|nr:hypothetical protein QAD02_013929 [Eretmocerus hayati]